MLTSKNYLLLCNQKSVYYWATRNHISWYLFNEKEIENVVNFTRSEKNLMKLNLLSTLAPARGKHICRVHTQRNTYTQILKLYPKSFNKPHNIITLVKDINKSYTPVISKKKIIMIK